MTEPLQIVPRIKDQHTLDKDACDKEFGFLLLQKREDGSSRPAGFCSRTFSEIGKSGQQHIEKNWQLFGL